MSIIRNLFIILNTDEIENIIENLELQNDCKYDLISFVDINNYEEKLYATFENIYNLSTYTKKEIINFYFNQVLDLSYNTVDKKEIKYNNIYINLDRCDIDFNENISVDYFGDNMHYGNYFNIKSYCNYEEMSYLFMQHGLHLGGFVPNYEFNNISPAIITFGQYSYEYISKKTCKPIIKIGPYIHYAANLYEDKFINHIKQILGKTLLVFPTHSIDTVYYEYDIDKFIEYIEKIYIEEKFESVLICMYWKDIELGKNKQYEEKGFKVVSAGHRNGNTKFLNKLKTIISISDYTISNALGTHTGYCVYLNKPHHIYNQHIDLVGINKHSLDMEFNRGLEFEKIYENEKKIFFNIFSEFRQNITKEQYELCNIYWGFDSVKTKDEMRFILQLYNNVFIQCYNKFNIKDKSIAEVNNIYLDYINKL